jgi:hypothetical protein
MLAIPYEHVSSTVRASFHTGEAGVAALLLATSESRAPTRCDTRFADRRNS